MRQFKQVLWGICAWGLSSMSWAAHPNNGCFELLPDDQLSLVNALGIEESQIREITFFKYQELNHLDNFVSDRKRIHYTNGEEQPFKALMDLTSMNSFQFNGQVLEQRFDLQNRQIYIKFGPIRVDRMEMQLNMSGVYQLGHILNPPQALLSSAKF
ncbi:hypothetical protein [Acinetobacter sp. YH12239]|uniref:hypothetical protein n=1 Tax=Acinetobacter sp. YH12239 TaxID=2601166 RepID=UPI0015D1B71B|nr:hypothetical protein [Acinetobacter sp. YH12239]